ncbi:MAG: hypothetical protein ACOC45_00815 [Alkalispirochaetaceae bacterium]
MAKNKGLFRNLPRLLRGVFETMSRTHREKVVSLTAFEARELENMFVLLLMGAFTGLPAPPSFLAAELIPHLQHELKVLNRRAENASDALAELAGALDIN